MKHRIALLVAVVAIASLAYAGSRWWEARNRTNPNEVAVSGTVEATEARLGFQTAGRITEIDVREGDRVKAGAILARLDAAQLTAQRAQAVARMNGANAMLAELQHGARREEVATAAAGSSAARVKLEDAQRDLSRSKKLYDGGAIPLESYQKAQLAERLAATQVQQAGEQESLVQKGPRSERIDAQKSQVREAGAAVDAIDALLRNTTIIAPIDGVITVKHHEVNETIAAGQPVVTLMNPADRWVRVYVPERRLAAVRYGAAVTIQSDTYPGRHYRGRVVYISEQAEFTPKNVQTTEERVKLVYAVKVSVEGDAAMDLKPGMPADVVVDAATTGAEQK